MRRAESEKRNGGADDASIESLASSTATEYPESNEAGWGDKELSAFLSTPDQVMQALSDNNGGAAGPSQQGPGMASLTTQYLQHFENTFRASRQCAAATGGASSSSAPPAAAPQQAAAMPSAGASQFWPGLPQAPVGHTWPQEQRAANPWAAAAHPYYQGQQPEHAAALAAHQAAQMQAQQEYQTAQHLAQHNANMMGLNAACERIHAHGSSLQHTCQLSCLA